MSRLIEKFHKASQVAAPPMGFRTARPAAAAPKILLIASLEAGTMENPADYLDGADAVLLRFIKAALTAKTIQKIASSLPDIPWGLYLADDDNKKATAVEAGGDFIIFPVTSQVADTPKDDKTGKILQVESSMDDSLLRAINDLPVDAVLVADTFEGNGSLVWHQLMIFQHLSNLLSKPLIVPVPTSVTEKELKVLWDAGVDGIIVEIDTAKVERLKNLRQDIDKLPSRSGRKRGKVNVVLPRTGGETPTATPPDEEEEEEEDE
jgi:hypothetical protein